MPTPEVLDNLKQFTITFTGNGICTACTKTLTPITNAELRERFPTRSSWEASQRKPSYQCPDGIVRPDLRGN